jgi:transposase
MKPLLFVRSLTSEERQHLEAGLRSQEAFVLKRCQMLLSNAEGKTVPQIAAAFGYAPESIRHVLHAFNQEGVAALTRKSNRPKSAKPILDEDRRARVKALLEQSPRSFNKERSTWTLPLLAQVSFEQGITPRLLDGDTLGVALKRLDIHWRRASASPRESLLMNFADQVE